MTDPLQLARDGAEYLRTGNGRHVTMDEVIAALDAAIAQRGEPVAWVPRGTAGLAWHMLTPSAAQRDWWLAEVFEPEEVVALYTAPPARVPLTDERTPMDRFENAIREVGVVAACEWFGHAADSDFTKETARVLAERAHGITGA